MKKREESTFILRYFDRSIFLYIQQSAVFILLSLFMQNAYANTAVSICQGYFLQTDILQSLSREELNSIKTVAAMIADLKNKPHAEVRFLKETLNTQVLQILKQKEFTGEIRHQFYILFRQWIQTFESGQKTSALQIQKVSIQKQLTLERQKNIFDVLKKYVNSTDLDSNTDFHIDLDTALLRSVKGDNSNDSIETTFFEQSKDPNIADMKYLIALGANVNVFMHDAGNPIREYDTALNYACRKGHLHAAQILIDAGAQTNKETLVQATASGNRALVEYLLKMGADKNESNSESDSPLLKAASLENSELVDVFIKLGVNLESTNKDGETALHLSAAFHDIDSLELLLAAGANKNHRSSKGNTPLISAVQGSIFDAKMDPKQEKVILALIKSQADINAKNKFSQTALVYAVKSGCAKLVELLLQAKADPFITYREPEISHSLNLLVVASEWVFTDIVALLIQYEVDKNSRDGYHETPLMAASRRNKIETVRFLLSIKVSKDKIDKGGFTALMHASVAGNKDIVQALLDAGANPRIKNGPRTALSMAIAMGHNEVAQMLKASLQKTWYSTYLKKLRSYFSKEREIQ